MTDDGQRSAGAPLGRVRPQRAAVGLILYTAFYIGSLFLTLENDLVHWITLVLVPLGILVVVERPVSVRTTLASVGLHRHRWRRGLLIAVAGGMALSSLQLVLSERADEIWDVITSGRVIVMYPMSFVLFLVLTAASEEFFFRGVLLSRTRRAFGTTWAVTISSVAFALYHLPYAYRSSTWSSHGHLGSALIECLYAGVLGLALGVLQSSTRNLFAAMAAHAAFMTPVVMTSIHIGPRP